MPERRDLDWKNLGFAYLRPRLRFQAVWDGEWSAGELTEESTLTIEEGACGLHYGQQCFEGLKAFSAPDGSAHLFRPEMNGKRMARTAERLLMEPVPQELFLRGVRECVAANLDLLPPHGHGASLYVRPLLIGVGDNLGLRPAPRYVFRVFCSPVGPYFKGGQTGVHLVVTDLDRAAPNGTGAYKAGGNYAGALLATKRAKALGFDEALFLDAREHRYLEEAGSANVYGIIAGHPATLVTPDSPSILPSVTMDSVLTLAREDLGLKVERRPVALEEVAGFSEMACTGTAAGIAPVARVRHTEGEVTFNPCPGPISTELYRLLSGIQRGLLPDPRGWRVPVAG
ncbi:MAG: branched-chain amino acid aminotransferase [Planctomycetota bacterium]